MNRERNHLVAVDLGSTFTRTLVAEVLDSGEDASQLRFLGFGEAESQGWRKGTIAHLDPVSSSVKESVGQAEAMAGVSVESAVVGIGGPHIQGLSSRASLTLSSRPRQVSREDVRRVIESARHLSLPQDREILHMVPQEFSLDAQSGIRDPIGMQASRLEVQVYLLTGSVAASQSVVTAVNRAGIVVETVVAEAFAVGEAVVTPAERELGAWVVVLGGGSCEMVAYYQGGLRMAAVIPIGGDHFTNDVAVGLHTGLPEAEAVKKTFGSVFSLGSHDGISFEVPGLGNQPSRLVPRQTLMAILEPRAQELLGFALEELRRCGLEQRLGAGIVLSGGGARLHGICDLAEQMFSVPARLGLPSYAHAAEGNREQGTGNREQATAGVAASEGLPLRIVDLPETLDSPEYATLVGLLLYGFRVRRLRTAQRRTLPRRWKGILGRKSREGVR